MSASRALSAKSRNARRISAIVEVALGLDDVEARLLEQSRQSAAASFAGLASLATFL